MPKIDVLVSATFQSKPFVGAGVPRVATQSLGAVAIISPAVDTDLGRGLASGSPITFINLVKPGELYGERLNQLDLRFGKLLRFGRTRTMLALNLFNAFNSNTPDVYLQFPFNTATYLNPLSITSARLAKFSAQFDF